MSFEKLLIVIVLSFIIYKVIKCGIKLAFKVGLVIVSVICAMYVLGYLPV